MKKIRDFPRYRKHQDRRAKDSVRTSGRRSRSARRQFNFFKLRRKVLSKGLGLPQIEAPANFSFVNNTTEMIEFIERLKGLLFNSKRDVVVDLSDVRNVSNDAIMLFLSVAQDRRVPDRTNVYINKPSNVAVAKRFQESGIDEHCLVQDLAAPRSGRIRVKSSYNANTEMANELIQHATRELFGHRTPLKKVQRILSECIANTEEHASGDPLIRKAKKWWGTVFCDKANGTAYFSILDNGVGIVESLRAEWFSRLPILAKYPNNIRLMRAVFSGNVLSSTNLSNRGNGLPAIYKASKRGEFQRLIVITNNISIDFDRNEYKLLPTPFSGTFFYWEVRGPRNE